VRPTLVDETGGDNDLLSVSDLRWCNILSVNWLLPSLR
jgi:hypothetical protein